MVETSMSEKCDPISSTDVKNNKEIMLMKAQR